MGEFGSIYFLASIAWTLLGLQAYIMALTFKIAIVPLLFCFLKFTIWEHS